MSDRQTVESPSLVDASDVVHQRSRLAILALLYEVGEAEFAEIRRITKLTDGNLSRHLQTLEEVGLIHLRKGFVGRRPRTWIELSEDGASAFEHEVQILRRIVAAADSAHQEEAMGSRTAGPAYLEPS